MEESYYKPSLFELAAADQLRDLLQPVSKYILSVFAQRNPRYLLRIFNSHDELFALAMLIIEHHYLTTWNGSFAENFYNLKRRKTPGLASEKATAALEALTKASKLQRKEIYGSLLFLVGIPYLRGKLHDYFEKIGGGVDADLFDDEEGQPSRPIDPTLPWWTRCKEQFDIYFKRFFPFVNTSYELFLLYYSARYIFNQSPYYRPWLQYLKVDHRRMNAQELQVSPSVPPTLRRKLWHYFLESLRYVLPVSLFAFKFLEWWYNSSSLRSSTRSFYSKDILPPLKPPVGLSVSKEKKESVKKGICPVCSKEIVNATAITPTGYVGCYKCVYGFVGKEKRCPVTGVSCTTADLRKIIG